MTKNPQKNVLFFSFKMVYINYFKKFRQIYFLPLFKQCLLMVYKKYQTRRFRFLVIFCLLLIIFVCSINYIQLETNPFDSLDSSPTHLFNTNTSLYSPLSKVNQQSHRLVLLWTDLFDNSYWHQPSYFNSSVIVSCFGTHQCRFTRDRRKLSQAAAVGFHLYDINRQQLPERMPGKTDNQSWIFITGESPVNFYYQNPSFFPHMLDHYFDQSISYKADSPFPIFSPIVKTRQISPNSSSEAMQRERQLNLDSLKLKKKPVVWVVSNCNTFSQREKYVEELRKFIPVDIYGKCGRPCVIGDNRQCQMDLGEYYFYLSFENSRCHSYITEKFWNIISDHNHRLVPIVMGATENDYERVAPKQSYVHVNQYETPADLAKFLRHLISQPEKYLQYLQWRESAEIKSPSTGGWQDFLCPLCQMAYERQLLPHIRLNFSSWYNPKTECHRDDVKIFTLCKQTNLRVWMTWAHKIDCP